MYNEIMDLNEDSYLNRAKKLAQEELFTKWHQDIENNEKAYAKWKEQALKEKPYLDQALSLMEELMNGEIDAEEKGGYEKFKNLIIEKLHAVISYSRLAFVIDEEFDKNQEFSFYQNIKAAEQKEIDKFIKSTRKELRNFIIKNNEQDAAGVQKILPRALNYQHNGDALVLPLAMENGLSAHGICVLFKDKGFTKKEIEKLEILQFAIYELTSEAAIVFDEETEVGDGILD